MAVAQEQAVVLRLLTAAWSVFAHILFLFYPLLLIHAN